MRHAQKQRIDWILKRKYAFNRSDLQKAFDISKPQASIDIKKYMELYPNDLSYNRSTKEYTKRYSADDEVVLSHQQNETPEPTSAVEKVVAYLKEQYDVIGAGPDPVGFLIAIHRQLVEERKEAVEYLKELTGGGYNGGGVPIKALITMCQQQKERTEEAWEAADRQDIIIDALIAKLQALPQGN